jgi:hypothetical protein
MLGWEYIADPFSKRSIFLAWDGDAFGYCFDIPKPEPSEVSSLVAKMDHSFKEFLATHFGPENEDKAIARYKSMDMVARELLREEVLRAQIS